MGIEIEYDERRCGYWVRGEGFDFFAYFTGEYTAGANDPGITHLEWSGSSNEQWG